MIALALKGEARPKGKPLDKDAHNRLAQKIAENGAVLLKNEGSILPLAETDIVLIGEMARTMRYQGAGSSHINPTMLTTLCDALPAVPFNPGCDEKGNVTEESSPLRQPPPSRQTSPWSAQGCPIFTNPKALTVKRWPCPRATTA